MIELKTQSLEDLRARKLRTWLVSQEAKDMRVVIQSKIALLEIEYLKVSYETMQFENKSGQAAELLSKIGKYKSFLAVMDEMGDQTEPYVKVLAANQ